MKMPKEIKEKIYEFLMKNRGKRFAVKHIWEQMKIASLPTIHKWVESLVAAEKVKVEDYGNVKLIYIE